jgi:GNAT superfamily N-acetyltransferase
VLIRLAEPADIPLLPRLEEASGAIFRDVGMPEVADYGGQSVAELEAYRRAGHAWVVEVDGALAGFLVADVVDGNLHVEQVSVHPDFARRGIGRLLLEHAAEHAVSLGLPALTLTTFVDVPWNGPYYARCGFRALGPAEETPGLRAIRAHEAALALDRWPRTCMRRDL